jgi:hypothetical protein
MAANSRDESLHELIRPAIGFLFGSGAGAALGLIGDQPELRPWGLAVLLICFVVAGGLFGWAHFVATRRAMFSLEKLEAAYVRTLSTTGLILAQQLDFEHTKPGFDPSKIRRTVMTTLATDLEDQLKLPLGEDEKSEWVQRFREGMKGTVTEWQRQAGEPIELGVGQFPRTRCRRT